MAGLRRLVLLLYSFCRGGEVKQLVQGYTAAKWPSWHWDPSSLVPGSVFTATPACASYTETDGDGEREDRS